MTSELTQDELDFTGKDLDIMYDTIDSPFFREQDASMIYETLKNKLIQRPFCDYLKRYIFRRSGLSGNWKEISLNDYRRIIMDSFDDNCTPASFTPTTAKLSALSKNWLTQTMVKRKVIFLLGFGLRMSTEDVSSFLIKVLRERDINPKNPFELICWYCYQHHYGFSKYVQLQESFDNMTADDVDAKMDCEDQTFGVWKKFEMINDDEDLLMKLSHMKTTGDVPVFSYTTRRHFDELYFKVSASIAMNYNWDEEERTNESIKKYMKDTENNPRISEKEKKKHISMVRARMKVFTENDITPSDLEKILCAAIPVDKHGNLEESKKSALYEQFNGYRLSRQRLTEILFSRTEVDRFDIITMNFFLASNKENADYKKRFMEFIENTNQILNECSLGEIMISNPYESFILMCLISDEPLGTYSDVLEMSYKVE